MLLLGGQRSSFRTTKDPTLKKILTIAFLSILPACGGGPARTETTTTDTVERGDEGGEMRRSSTETREVDRDGAETTDSTVTTSTSTPPPSN